MNATDGETSLETEKTCNILDSVWPVSEVWPFCTVWDELPSIPHGYTMKQTFNWEFFLKS